MEQVEEFHKESRGLKGAMLRLAEDRGPQSPEDKIMHHAGITALVLAVLGYKLISTGYVSSRLFNGEPTSYPLDEIPGILWRVTHSPLDPNEAWEPVNTGGAVPGPLAYWGTFLVLLVVHYLVLAVPLFALRRTWSKGSHPSETEGQWSEDKEVSNLLLDPKVDPPEKERLVVGRRKGKNLAIDRSLSILVVGPLHSGKTKSMSIPSLLEWDGPALVVVSKGHLMDQTIGWRRKQGLARVFDPAGASRYDRSGWVMVEDCGDWEGAIAMAQHLGAAVYGSVGGRMDSGDPKVIEQGALWGDAMAMALAPYLYAAAVTGQTVNQVARWIIQQEQDEVLSILRPVDSHAAAAHEAAFYRRDDTMDVFFHHVYDMLSVYGDPVVAASATKRDIMPSNLLNGRKETLYLFAPEHDQARFQPLFTMIVRQTLAAVNAQYAATGRPLRKPLLVVLDGAVGIASIDTVSQMASTGGAKGVEMLTIFEEGDWKDGLQGNATATLLENHHALVVMSGNWRGHGETASLAGWPGITDGLGPDESALFYDHHRPIRLQMRKWQDDDRLRARVDDPDGVAKTQTGPRQNGTTVIADSPEYTLIEQTSAWRRRRRESDQGGQVAADVSERKGKTRNVFRRPGAGGGTGPVGARQPAGQGQADGESRHYRPGEGS